MRKKSPPAGQLAAYWMSDHASQQPAAGAAHHPPAPNQPHGLIEGALGGVLTQEIPLSGIAAGDYARYLQQHNLRSVGGDPDLRDSYPPDRPWTPTIYAAPIEPAGSGQPEVNRIEKKTAMELEGTVEAQRFSNPDTGYAVLRLSTPDGEAVAVGPLAGLRPGETARLKGEWTTHPQYGRQFKVETYSIKLPTTVEGLIDYLGSGAIKYVGPGTAKRIVAAFGLQTLERLDEDINCLAQVKGIGKKRLQAIAAEWERHKAIRQVYLFLAGIGVTPGLAAKVYKCFGNDAVATITANPYCLTDIRGVGFKTADQVATRLGTAPDSPARLGAGLLHALGQRVLQGHTFAPQDRLVAQAVALLDAPAPSVARQLPQLHQAGRVLIEPAGALDPGANAVYLPALHKAEVGLARYVESLRQAPSAACFSGAKAEAGFCLDGLRLSERQREAVQATLTNKITVLTGGPGTGKTTCLRAILKACDERGIRYALCSPTGRAAKRLSQVTGQEAGTIHRLLGYARSNGAPSNESAPGFEYDEHNPLPLDLLVVDEASMLDLSLAYHLFKAIPAAAHVLLVGDVDQLPSVGAGNVLRDLIDAGRVCVVRLDVIYRQAQDSQIVANAHRINQGEMPLFGKDTSDCFFFGEDDPARAAALIVDLVHKRIPARFGLCADAVQVLAPMRKGEAGVETLNRLLQAALNPPSDQKQERALGATTLRTGDRVMQVRNDYDREVFNGDIGAVGQLDLEAQTVQVDFDGRLVEYDFEAAGDDLVLAYAATIHKAQGSEYPAVVIPLLTQHYIMLQRNLVYTGLTRAKRLVVFVGSKQALGMAVRNDKVTRRYSGLRARLSGGGN